MGKNATQPPWAATGDDKAPAVKRMFAEISSSYDLMNSAMSLRLHHRWRREAVRMLGLAPGDSALDVCCGTGDCGLPLRKAVGRSGRVVGADFCLPMLDRAKGKGVPMALLVGDACRLPVRSESFDAVTLGWGLRNVSDVAAALAEVFRILRPGGRFVSLDMAIPSARGMRWISGIACRRGVPILGSMLGKRDAYKYLPESTQLFASRDEQVTMIREAGFRGARWRDLFFGNICIHYGEK